MSTGQDKTILESEDEKTDAEDNAQTIRPTWSPTSGKLTLAAAPPASMAAIVEDYSDLAAEEDDDWLQDKVADFKACFFILFYADDIHIFAA